MRGFSVSLGFFLFILRDGIWPWIIINGLELKIPKKCALFSVSLFILCLSFTEFKLGLGMALRYVQKVRIRHKTVNAIRFSSLDVYHFHFRFISNLSTNWPKLTAQPHRPAEHTTREWKRWKSGSISFIEPNGKRIESDIKCNTITPVNIAWDYSGTFFFSVFNWFFARIRTVRTHTSIFPSQVSVLSIHGLRTVERTSSLTQYTHRDATACISLNWNMMYTWEYNSK